jgi:L-fuconolactonase
VIDAHFHIWCLERGDYGWLTPALAPIHRDITLDDWRAQSRRCGVTAGILVQAAPTEAETRFLLEQASAAPDVLGVVGWTDLLAPDSARTVERLAREAKLKGLRPMLHDIDDPDWILQSALQPALRAMSAQGLVFDALIRSLHIGAIHRLARQHPELRIVIDHAAKPAIARGQWSAPGDDWAQALAGLARDTDVWCKLSGLWTEAAGGAPATDSMRYAHHVLQAFGPQRVIWGSDWPVLELAGGYQDWHGYAWGLVPPGARQAVFEGNARRAYRL